MNKDRFDFSEIDAAGKPDSRCLGEQRKAVDILNEKMEKLENRLAKALSALDVAVSSLHKASRVTIGEESRRVLEQEGDAI